ncbi:MAG: hypothetical protein F7C81_00915 [Desulfurococcales archaeon]|nr:hypothetical protein [Desulfurococcales archaeon]
MSGAFRRIKERSIKEVLLEQLKSSNIEISDVVEWLWDDFGKRVKGDWRSIEKAVLGDPDISPQDVAVFMIDNGITPNEGAWDVEPRRGMHSNKRGSGGF